MVTFTVRPLYPQVTIDRRLDGNRTVLNTAEKIQISYSYWELNPESAVVHPYCNYYYRI